MKTGILEVIRVKDLWELLNKKNEHGDSEGYYEAKLFFIWHSVYAAINDRILSQKMFYREAV